MSQIEDIKAIILEASDKLDALRSGKSIETAFLIERADDTLTGFMRDDLDLIEQALKQ
jgi:hypothetical protein